MTTAKLLKVLELIQRVLCFDKPLPKGVMATQMHHARRCPSQQMRNMRHPPSCDMTIANSLKIGMSNFWIMSSCYFVSFCAESARCANAASRMRSPNHS